MKKLILVIIIIVAFLLALSFWRKSDKPDLNNPVMLTMWHVFVEDMRITFDELVNEFNKTAGAENGIVVKATSVTDAGVINKNLLAAANNDPGAPRLPDMAVVNPRAAVTLVEKGVLVDLEQYFSKSELNTFVPQFIEEGRLGAEQLYIMPIAKSAEVLYVNRTFFDRFSAETGIGIEKLSTFEGIAEAAVKYYEWTDAMTPDVPNDGKTFFYPEGLFNQAMIGFQQLGGDIVKDKKLNLQDAIFKRIWDCYYPPAVQGGVAIYSGYSNYLAVTGDVI
ncbi:MAG: extracellular solute-binding protein, partial [Synergistaceae bacterium]|nr:extracellular solute-binding protein [Synergistaceae bacterium]